MDDQRLLSLDTLFALADGLNLMAQGKPAPDNLLAKAQELREFEMPRPFFTNTERSEWAAGLYNTSHATLQMRTDLTKMIKGAGLAGRTGRGARPACSLPARHSGGAELRLLRAAVGAGSAQQSAAGALARFLGRNDARSAAGLAEFLAFSAAAGRRAAARISPGRSPIFRTCWRKWSRTSPCRKMCRR